ncbi:ATP-binding protein [Chondrinema litorale]|uniref:ATP-binding protein n=1 Tax=Chondrinema litorale TaxID=2994555 RepID=UPI002542A581|nr:ATP-binding protein [Chondrinema litorale]UZR99585.1 ATP-binding protein [Chondrinema litorale]
MKLGKEDIFILHKLSEEFLTNALKTCATEPISTPNAIQPHGALLALDPSTYKIKGVSENISYFFDLSPKDALEQPIETILGDKNTLLLKSVVINKPLNPTQAIRIQINEIEYDANAYISNDLIVFEIEPVLEEDISLNYNFFFEDLRNFAIALRNATSREELFDNVVAHIRKLTGFDRVKLYQFDREWNGKVIAEDKKENVPSYKGLNFPASDIPAQARELYSKNFLRIISDIRYKPSKIIGSKDIEHLLPLDMTYSVLRSVSPVHIQYLENMGVGASMSISIIQDGKLWGLIACHHLTEKHVAYRTRMIAELMGHIFSTLLSSFNEIAEKKEGVNRILLLNNLSKKLLEKNLIDEQIATELMGIMKADAMAIAIKGKILQFNTTLGSVKLEKLFEYFKSNSPLSIFQTNQIDQTFKDHEVLKELDGGLMVVPINHSDNDTIIWFRKPLNSEVKWAGKPEKKVEETKAGLRLSPRSSFNLWKETIKSKSAPWSNFDIETALAIVRLFLEYERNVAELANQAKSDFLSNMSHKLRTPMNAIIGVASILDKSPNLPSELKDFVKTLNISSESLLTLINDLLDIAKIESNKIELEHIPFNFAEILESTKSMMVIKVNEKQIDLNFHYPEKSELYFIGDPNRIRQILFNLLSNAIKFTQEGFINVYLKVKENNDIISDIILFVSDTGIGMSKKQLNKIFDKFTQADQSISRNFGGTGLGLSITKSIVELMNGKISVTSLEGMGSQFQVELPLEMQRKQVASKPSKSLKKLAPKTPVNVTKDKKKILLAEDYEGNIIVVIYFLQHIGYETFVVKNGLEAIDKLKEDQFDLVLMDVQMPVMDGYDATRTIREMQKKKEVDKCPIIGMTAHAFQNESNKCLEAGMDDYITKPFSYEELDRLITKYL